MRHVLLLVLVIGCASHCLGQERSFPEVLPQTAPLTLSVPLIDEMLAGINQFALRKIEQTREERAGRWKRDVSSLEAGERSLIPVRERFREIIGAVEPLATEIQFQDLSRIVSVQTTRHDPQTDPDETATYSIVPVRWNAFGDVTGEGLILKPAQGPIRGLTIAIPDATWTPEEFCGAAPDSSEASRIPRWLVQQGMMVVIPTLISRDATFSGVPEIAMTNQSHREWIYRQSFELGRHPIGYEVLKVLAAVDALQAAQSTSETPLPIGVCGVGEGGLLALHAAALEPRIRSTLVCGYFQPREEIWREPIDRNLFRLLREFGDAEIAGMIAPRPLTIEACGIPEVVEPAPVRKGERGGAAPGEIRTATPSAVTREFERAREHFSALQATDQIRLVLSGTDGAGPSGQQESLTAFLHGLGLTVTQDPPKSIAMPVAVPVDPDARQQRQILELIRHSEQVFLNSSKVREEKWKISSVQSPEEWRTRSQTARQMVWEELIGRLPDPSLPLNPLTRRVLDEPEYVGYEVLLHVHQDLIAGGILLLPRDLTESERRPVVVCQHGLEGVPMGMIKGKPQREFPAYKDFASTLAKQGLIVYAPQNPYVRGDRFRVLQRMSNPVGNTLFSYIVAQHQATLSWLSSLPGVDPDRIAFYGLSYGGKTAVRVPPLLDQYCLSICSGDFNEWVLKNITHRDGKSYLYSGEYEIWEWNMAHLANYAELSFLVAPRPFMVERGHHDGVALDEWVAWEYAKVRRFYSQLGLSDRTDIEFFDGPHCINGKGTFEFLHRHLNWKDRSQPGKEP